MDRLLKVAIILGAIQTSGRCARPAPFLQEKGKGTYQQVDVDNFADSTRQRCTDKRQLLPPLTV